MDENKRLSSVIKYLKSANRVRNQTDFGVVMGFSRSMVSQLIQGTRPISGKFVREVCIKFPEINERWFLTGEGEMLVGSANALPVVGMGGLILHEGELPLIPYDAVVKFGMDNYQKAMELGYDRYIIPDFHEAEFLMRVKGSAMYPKYASGDIIACRKIPRDTFFQWNRIYAIDTEQGILTKRVFEGDDREHVTLVSDNDKYRPFQLPLDKIKALAIVIGVVRVE